RNGLSGFFRKGVENIDNVIQQIIINRRSVFSGFRQAAHWRRRLIAADLSSEAAPTERAPDERSHALIEAKGHELPLVLAADERIVDLMRNVAGPAVAFAGRKRFH